MKGLLQVLYSPDKTFEEVKIKKAAWVVPLIALIILQTVSALLLIRTVGLEQIVRLQLQSNPSMVERMGQEGIDKAAAKAAKSPLTKVLSYVAPPVSIAIIMPLVSGIFLGLLLMMSAITRYSKVLAVSAYSWFAYTLILSVASELVLHLKKDYEDLDFKNLVGLNPAMFLDKSTTAKPLYSLATSFDLFSFWLIFLLALGLYKVSDKTSLSKCFMVVVIPWGIYILAKAGLSLLF